jgi:hypothetical protein
MYQQNIATQMSVTDNLNIFSNVVHHARRKVGSKALFSYKGQNVTAGKQPA